MGTTTDEKTTATVKDNAKPVEKPATAVAKTEPAKSPATAPDAAAQAAAAKVVDAAADAIKVAAKSQQAEGTAPPNDGSMDRTPTKTQIEETAPWPITSSPEGKDLKLARHDDQPGTGVPTTVVEEVRIVDPKIVASKEEDTLRSMRVLAHSQGVNQHAPGFGTVLQNGEHLPEVETTSVSKENLAPKV